MRLTGYEHGRDASVAPAQQTEPLFAEVLHESDGVVRIAGEEIPTAGEASVRRPRQSVALLNNNQYYRRNPKYANEPLAGWGKLKLF